MSKMPEGIHQYMIKTRRGGADYLPVAYRLVWFRDECPTWSIVTDLVRGGPEAGYALMRATIMDDGGRVIATAHKVEDSKGFEDFTEKAETGAIGRALAIAGYGTQFAAELRADDAADPVDAPAAQPQVTAQRAAPQASSTAVAAGAPEDAPAVTGPALRAMFVQAGVSGDRVDFVARGVYAWATGGRFDKTTAPPKVETYSPAQRQLIAEKLPEYLAAREQARRAAAPAE